MHVFKNIVNKISIIDNVKRSTSILRDNISLVLLSALQRSRSSKYFLKENYQSLYKREFISALRAQFVFQSQLERG